MGAGTENPGMSPTARALRTSLRVPGASAPRLRTWGRTKQPHPAAEPAAHGALSPAARRGPGTAVPPPLCCPSPG